MTPPPEQPRVGELRLVEVLEALSDPVRLEIVRRLGDADGSELPCSTFHGIGGVGVPTLSHHLKVLREAGITHTTLEGRQRLLSLRRQDLSTRFPGVLDGVLDALANGG